MRELYREAVARGQLGGEVLGALFSVERGFRLPVGVVEGQQMMLHERPRHRLREAKRGGRRPCRSSSSALIGACRQWRDRSILALLGRAGLRCGEAVTLRMSDVHLAESSLEVGCSEPGAHLHVRRREDVDGGATKSLDPRIVLADDLVVSALTSICLSALACRRRLAAIACS